MLFLSSIADNAIRMIHLLIPIYLIPDILQYPGQDGHALLNAHHPLNHRLLQLNHLLLHVVNLI